MKKILLYIIIKNFLFKYIILFKINELFHIFCEIKNKIYLSSSEY